MTLFPKRKLAKLELKDRKRARRNDDLRGLVDGFRTIFSWITKKDDVVVPARTVVELNSNEPHPYHSVGHDHTHDFGACDISERK